MGHLDLSWSINSPGESIRFILVKIISSKYVGYNNNNNNLKSIISVYSLFACLYLPARTYFEYPEILLSVNKLEGFCSPICSWRTSRNNKRGFFCAIPGEKTVHMVFKRCDSLKRLMFHFSTESWEMAWVYCSMAEISTPQIGKPLGFCYSRIKVPLFSGFKNLNQNHTHMNVTHLLLLHATSGFHVTRRTFGWLGNTEIPYSFKKENELGGTSFSPKPTSKSWRNLKWGKDFECYVSFLFAYWIGYLEKEQFTP